MKKIFIIIFAVLISLAGYFVTRQFAMQRSAEDIEQKMNSVEEAEVGTEQSEIALPETNVAPDTVPPETPLPENPILTLITSMTLEEKVAQLFILSCAEVTEKDLLASYNLGGVIFFKEDIQSIEQTRELTAKLQNRAKTPLFIGIDEEGGMVSRLGNLPVKKFQNAAYTADDEEAYERGAEIAELISGLGFNLNFAPVADVNTNPENSVIGERAFSPEPERAAELVAAFVEGSQQNNVMAALKHFPGHGDTSADTHEGIAVAPHSIERLRAVELIPFKKGIEAGAAFVMIGHLSLPQITGSDEPALFSEKIVAGLLKNELGFGGLIISDALNMGAVTQYYTPGETAVKALLAGVDVLLMPTDFEEAFQAVLNAVESGELTEERINASLERILFTKQHFGIFQPEFSEK